MPNTLPAVTWTNLYSLRGVSIDLSHNVFMPGGIGFPNAGDQFEYDGNRKFGANTGGDLYTPGARVRLSTFFRRPPGSVINLDSSDFTWTLRTGGDSFFGGLADQVHGRCFLAAGARYLSYNVSDPVADNFYYTEQTSNHGYVVDVWWEYPADNKGIADPIFIVNTDEQFKMYVQLTAVLDGNGGDVPFVAFNNKGSVPGSKYVYQGAPVPQRGYNISGQYASGRISKAQYIHYMNHSAMTGGLTYQFFGHNPDSRTEEQGIGTVQTTMYDSQDVQTTVIHGSNHSGLNHIIPGINTAQASWTFSQVAQLAWLPTTITVPVGGGITTPPPFANQNNPGLVLSCFVGDTKISMADGTTKEICDIIEGDKVLSVDTKSGQKVETHVVETSEHTETPNYININNGELKGTPNHEMYDGTNWRPLSEFKKGETIQTFDGTLKEIESIHKVYALTTTYNFEVESDHHNYFANGFLAHNKSFSGTLGPGGFPVGLPPACCFIGTTKVTMSDGSYKNIDQIKIGDQVKTHKGTNEVIHIEKVKLSCKKLYDINNTGEYFITEDHIIKTDAGWKSINPKLTKELYPKLADLICGKLVKGDSLITENGNVKVEALDQAPTHDPDTDVYDISIKQDETLFANGILAHNHGSYLFRNRYPKPTNPYIPPSPPVPPVPVPCTPSGNPPVKTLMVANTAAGKHITSNPKFVGHSGSDGKIKFFQSINPSLLSNKSSKYVHNRENCVPEGILTATLTLPKSGRQVEGGEILWHYKKCVVFLGVNTDGYLVTLSDPRHKIGPSDQSYDLAFGEIELNGRAIGHLGSTTLLSISSNSGNSGTARGYAGWGEFQLEDIAYTHNSDVYNRRDTYYNLVSSAGDEPTTQAEFEAFAHNIGSVDYNYKTHQFGRVTFSNIPLSITRALTAESIGGLGDESVAYVPRGFVGEPVPPLIALIGDDCTGYQTVSSVTEWITQGSNFGNNTSNIGMSAEWPDCEQPDETYCPTVSSGIRSLPVIGGLNPPPMYRRTTNSIPGSANGAPYARQGYLAVTHHGLTRPRRRLPVASGSAELNHHNHTPRAYDLFSVRYDSRTYQEVGYQIAGTLTTSQTLSSRVFSMTYGNYKNTTNPQVTSCRVRFEHNENPYWDIVEFTSLTGLSAIQMATFLSNVGQVSLSQPLTADIPFVQMIGFVTLHGSLTAEDGSYYAAALTRCKKPVWVEAGAHIGLFGTTMNVDYYDNYVVVTSGKDLFLPYLTYREKLSD